MSDIPPLNQRIVRVVARFGGSAKEAARAIGCTPGSVRHIARQAGVKFRGGSDRRFDCAVLSVLNESTPSPPVKRGFKSPRLEGRR